MLFPPFCLIGRCLEKIRHSQATVILIATIWINQPWYHSELQNYPEKSKNFESPFRRTTTTFTKPNSKNSSVESFRDKEIPGKLSTTASNLIEQSKTLGTRNHYKSAWGLFKSWCSERKADPVSCPLGYILNY